MLTMVDTHRYLTVTMTLKGAEHRLVRTLTVRDTMTVEELMDRMCIALGRYPNPDAILRIDGRYLGREAHHFEHPRLSEELLHGPVPDHLQDAEFILNRLDGWVFRIDILSDEYRDKDVPAILKDTVPLLPGPQLRLAEYNAVQMARHGEPLPPDLERAIIIEALIGLMTPELPDPESAMELYTVLRAEGRQDELRSYHHFISGVPDVEILFELLRLATSGKPPRVTNHGFLPVAVVRTLAGKFPALVPPVSHAYGYRGGINSARDATALTAVLQVGVDADVLTAEPGSSLSATDFGRDVLAGADGSLPQLRARILRAWIARPLPSIPEIRRHRPRLTFQEYLESQDTEPRDIDDFPEHRLRPYSPPRRGEEPPF